MFYLNKIVWFWLNPSALPILVAAIGFWLILRGKRPLSRKVGLLAVAASVVFIWFASTLSCVCLLGLPLERPYLDAQSVESVPSADAIVVLGGGIGKAEEMTYPDMSDGADRIWHGARLYKAGKAPIVIVSGTNDLYATVPLLIDFGVPPEAIVVDNESRNTYENSRFTEDLLLSNVGDPSVPKRVLLVTSAWHMTRSLGNFSKTSLVAIPAPADFKAHNMLYGRQYWWSWIAPTADNFAQVGAYAKEWLGRLARR
jgi:uncharacterized SAM-binding protein YcdF (DUF218 family)